MAILRQPDPVEDFQAHWDEKSFNEIERSDPMLISHIERLIEVGHEPAAIKRMVLQHAPQRWPESRQVEQAARHIKATNGG